MATAKVKHEEIEKEHPVHETQPEHKNEFKLKDTELAKEYIGMLLDRIFDKIKRLLDKPMLGLYVAGFADLAAQVMNSKFKREHPLYSNFMHLILSVIEKEALLAHETNSHTHLVNVEQKLMEMHKELKSQKSKF